MYKFDVDVPEAVRDLATKTMIGFKLIRDEYAFAECLLRSWECTAL